MQAKTYFADFARDEDGAVTVDWVALMAALVLIGIGVGLAISLSTQGLANDVAGEIDTRGVWTY